MLQLYKLFYGGVMIMKLDEKTRKSYVSYMIDGITHIVKKFDKRPPGSEGEKQAQEYMAEELKSSMDTVKIEEFKLHPGSFFGWIYITLTLLLMAFASFWFNRLLCIIIIILALIPMFTQLVLYREVFDFLYRKKTSRNVIAVKKPKGEVKRRIIMGGHADAVWEWTLHYRLGFNIFRVIMITSVVGAIYFFLLSLITIIAEKSLKFATIRPVWIMVLAIIGIIFVPFWISLIWFSDEKQIVDGANDNLTGCYIPMAVAKYFKDNKIELENTEFIVMNSGSEEAGLRGAKRYAKRHKEELKDVETIAIPFETVREKDFISVFESDLNMTVKSDRQVLALVKNAGRSTGHDIKIGKVELGATDAAAYQQAGIKSACFAGMDHNLKDYYHTRRDTADNLDGEALGIAFDCALEIILEYDKNGLPCALPKNRQKFKKIREVFINKLK